MPQRNGHDRKTTTPAKSRHRGSQSAGDQVRGVADRVISTAEETMQAAQQSTEACLMEGRKKLEGMSESLAHYVQKSPMRALAIAAGTGAALMLFLRRR